jgi:GTP-binding protein Era
MTDAPTRAGFVALIGEPNAGKSTLLNAVVGAKLSIVTHKVQTTRFRIRGVLNEGVSQIVFVDTPGLFAPKRTLDRAMVAAAWAGASDADVVMLLIEAHRGVTKGVQRILDDLDKHLGPDTSVALVINKIDRVKRDTLLALTTELQEKRKFEEVFYVSATRSNGLEGVVNWLEGKMPEGPWLYPEDQLGDASMRAIAAEITREKLMLRLHQELPYQMTVETEAWEERKDGSVKIDQAVIVAKEGHRPIILGKGGQTLKQIGQASREELSEMMDRKVHLFLRVKVDERWQEDRARYSEMGLEFPEG